MIGLRAIGGLLASLAVLGLALSACKPKVEASIEQHRDYQSRRFDVPADARLVDTITFTVDYPDYPGGGSSPYVNLGWPEDALAHMRDADQIVVTEPKLTLIIDYPVNHVWAFTVAAPSDKGFTRAELAQAIADVYRYIYEAEEASSETRVVPPGERKGLKNRNETNGSFGIWGHDIGDLVLHTVELRRQPGGELLAVLLIDS